MPKFNFYAEFMNKDEDADSVRIQGEFFGPYIDDVELTRMDTLELVAIQDLHTKDYESFKYALNKAIEEKADEIDQELENDYWAKKEESYGE